MMQDSFKSHKLSALRAFHQLDQAELAQKTGLSRSTIQRLENGKSKKTVLETVQALAQFFNVPVTVFFTDEAIQIQ
jgi:transcriptional regulator with XRE-family HTH domain